MTPEDLEQLAERAYGWAGLPADQAASPLMIAGNILGWDALVESTKSRQVARLQGGKMLVRADVSPGRRSWHVAREIGRLVLERSSFEITDVALDSLAAFIRTPRLAFGSAVSQLGPAFSDLAFAFMISESSAALRYGEVTGTRVALLAPKRPIRVRGVKTAKMRPKSIRLVDAPDRVVRLYAS